ncbi:unnamed protein product [Phaedon cochleariae]|uniref:Carboxylic ester hydrolase n=1 Tax=Phaedon cochleariae TaxID=80249 RepID=A0A9N9SID8_PHACE|nr:unnamed protein product [Phaedon cochleariae]
MVVKIVLFVLFSLSSLFFISAANNDSDDLIVQLAKGKIRGHVLESWNGKNYYAFQEIPYAAPPIGAARFQLPREVEPWEGILNTTSNSRVCYQLEYKYDSLHYTEDCLLMNVYSPSKPGSKTKLPVLVWIHGGGLVGQSGAFQYYGPKYIMDYEVVVVTFNYRLAAFGFVTTEDDVIPANIGLKDQRFALQWVKENIILFGGDPDHITIAGESAGALCVGFHQLGQWNGETESFHAAIIESGAALGDLSQPDARANAFDLGRQLDKKFNSSESEDLLTVLQNAAPEDILKINKKYGTVIEKDGPFSYAGLQSFMDGNIKKIPTLIGFNSEEYIHVGGSKNIETRRQYDKDPSLLIPTTFHMSPQNRSIAGALLMKVYTNTSFEEDLGAFVRWTSDRTIIIPICKQVELGSTQSPHYLYQFSYKGDLGGKNNPPVIVPGCGTVGHEEELRYVWDNGSNSDLNDFPVEDQLMHLRFIKLWTNFIKYYNPTPEDDALLNNISWPKSNAGLLYLNINATMEVLENPRHFKQQKVIFDDFIQEPYISY